MNICMIFRAPVGGLFRHVIDLSEELCSRGHSVFFIFSDGEVVDPDLLEKINSLSQGNFIRIKMARLPSISDYRVTRLIRTWLSDKSIDVLHGHGAKGGVYARLLRIMGGGERVVYTPHGGALHYRDKFIFGRFFAAVERFLLTGTDALVFESKYAKDVFLSFVDRNPKCSVFVVKNGLKKSDFFDSSVLEKRIDFVFLGELRKIKGVDVFLKAIHLLNEKGIYPRCEIYGDGPDQHEFVEMARRLGVSDVDFKGRTNDPLGVLSSSRCFVLSSYNESLPYVVLESVSRNVPVLAANVGGVCEIISSPVGMFDVGDFSKLANLMTAFLCGDNLFVQASAINMAYAKKAFCVKAMAEEIESIYFGFGG